MGEYTKVVAMDVPVLARFISIAFGVKPDGAAKWLSEKLGVENLRVMRDGAGDRAPIVSCLGRIPMAQWWGARSVPMVGIAGVATPPEHRGKGHARRMMQHAVREAASDGFPISVLYASTQPLYRAVGFEQAGHRFVSKLPMQTLGISEKARDVVAICDAEMPEVKACYGVYAKHYAGMTDRTDYLWERVRNRRDETYHGFGVRENGVIAGYLFALTDGGGGRERGDLLVSDIAWSTPSAAKKVLGLLADFTTMTEHALLAGSPLHPLATLLPQQRFSIDLKEYWMLRILRVPEAVAARGYAKGIDASAVFEIRDDIVQENNGRWRVSVRNGVGVCERSPDAGGTGGRPVRGAVRCDVRAFAPLYTGLYTASQARAIGLVEGDDDAVAAADALFTGQGTPWMADFF